MDLSEKELEKLWNQMTLEEKILAIYFNKTNKIPELQAHFQEMVEKYEGDYHKEGLKN